MVSEKPKEKILTYQALRGIAALFILFSHMHYLSASDNPFWHCLWNGFMSNCGIFTSFFFLCSGFFLQYTWKKDVSFGKYIKGKSFSSIFFIVFSPCYVETFFQSENRPCD